VEREEFKSLIDFEINGTGRGSVYGEIRLCANKHFTDNEGRFIDPHTKASSGRYMREIFKDEIVDMLLLKIGKIKIEPLAKEEDSSAEGNMKDVIATLDKTEKKIAAAIHQMEFNEISAGYLLGQASVELKKLMTDLL